MKKEFYFGTHFNNSSELPKKRYPCLKSIDEADKLISLLIKENYKINRELCYANFDETFEIPFNQAKKISQEENLESVVIKGDGLEIMVKNKSSGSGVFGGSFNIGIEGHISLKNAKTKEELNKVEKLIQESWYIKNHKDPILRRVNFQKRRRLGGIKFRGYKI